MLSCTGLRSAEKFPAPSVVFKSTVVITMIINLPGYLVFESIGVSHALYLLGYAGCVGLLALYCPT